jgi:hypothetical protein
MTENMSDNLKCPKCGGEMEKGYLKQRAGIGGTQKTIPEVSCCDLAVHFGISRLEAIYAGIVESS